jgi:hypothetical protein
VTFSERVTYLLANKTRHLSVLLHDELLNEGGKEESFSIDYTRFIVLLLRFIRLTAPEVALSSNIACVGQVLPRQQPMTMIHCMQTVILPESFLFTLLFTLPPNNV